MLKYGSECWAMYEADKRAFEETEVKFLRYVLGVPAETKYVVTMFNRN
jgi:hypothetical protein